MKIKSVHGVYFSPTGATKTITESIAQGIRPEFSDMIDITNDDALKELHDIAPATGFIPVAGGAFVAEHSYSSKSCPIAPNRPDDRDITERAGVWGCDSK